MRAQWYIILIAVFSKIQIFFVQYSTFQRFIKYSKFIKPKENSIFKIHQATEPSQITF